jgi:cysteinyl-tRNA synthetase
LWVSYADIFSVKNNVNITVDGIRILFDESTGKPFIDNNSRTLVPLRTVLEAYGALVDWDFQKREAIINYNNVIIKVPITKKFIYKNNMAYINDTEAIIKDSKTYIPIRKVIELIGGEVNYDMNSNTVIINKNHFIKDKITLNNNLLYQLQDIDFNQILNSNFDILIMDYSAYGDDESAYSKNQIVELKDKGIVTLGYISIGEAETYRYYWTKNFSDNNFLGIENKDWDENYKVRYWDEKWQNIIFNYLDKLIDAGFDGAYLDIVDGYEYWSDEDNNEKKLLGDPNSEEESANLMIDFIVEINQYCKEKNPDFLIVPQNGSNIIKYDNGKYISNIDGIGIEDLWYMETLKRDEVDVTARIDNLNRISNAGKFVLVTDYLYDDSESDYENEVRINNFISNANEYDFKYYIANKNRNLDDMIIFKE